VFLQRLKKSPSGGWRYPEAKINNQAQREFSLEPQPTVIKDTKKGKELII
jgi:hypothetical protein